MDKRPIKILLVEDNAADAGLIREMLVDAGGRDAFALVHVMRIADAMKCLCKETFDIVLLDLMLPDSAGMETFISMYNHAPSIPIVVLSGFTDESLAVNAVRNGAQDYLVKGQVDGPMLARAIKYAIERKLAGSEGINISTAANPGERGGDDGYLHLNMAGTSPGLKEVTSLIKTVANTSNTSVFIQGETGTGKGLVASAIHFLSSRRANPFIKLNCSAIPDTLLETELFGYEKGAFTDAKQTKKGLFEVADGGTLFLDEIGDMDIRLQPKLLQALESRTFRRIGSVADIKVDVRIIAATNRDLNLLIREKRFREDLYYRLQVMTIAIPPLRERKEDIPALSEYFIQEHNKAYGKGVKSLPQQTREIFLNYQWPGNVRELKNVIERAMIIASTGEILPQHLPYEITHFSAQRSRSAAAVYPDTMTLDEIEKFHIINVMEKAKGNKTHAAKFLGISRLTLREKIKRYGL